MRVPDPAPKPDPRHPPPPGLAGGRRALAAAVERAHLIELGSATHSQNRDQRLVPLAIERTGERLVLDLPASRSAAPPGHYLPFVVDRDGVPSRGVVPKLGEPGVEPGRQVRGHLPDGGPDLHAVPVVGAPVSGDPDALDTLSSTG